MLTFFDRGYCGVLQILERRIVRSTVSLSLPARGWLPAPTVHVYSPSREMLAAMD